MEISFEPVVLPELIKKMEKLYSPFLDHNDLTSGIQLTIFHKNKIVGFLQFTPTTKAIALGLIPKEFRDEVDTVKIVRMAFKYLNYEGEVLWRADRANYASLSLLNKLGGFLIGENEDQYKGIFYSDGRLGPKRQIQELQKALVESKVLYGEWLSKYNSRRHELRDMKAYLDKQENVKNKSVIVIKPKDEKLKGLRYFMSELFTFLGENGYYVGSYCESTNPRPPSAKSWILIGDAAKYKDLIPKVNKDIIPIVLYEDTTDTKYELTSELKTYIMERLSGKSNADKPNKLSEEDIAFYMNLYKSESTDIYNHVNIVTQLVTKMGSRAKVQCMDELVAAAIVHDLADLGGKEATTEEAYNRVLTDELLNKRFNKAKVSVIANAVRKHRPDCKDSEYSLMEQILRDADALSGFTNLSKLLVRDKARFATTNTNPIELLMSTLNYVTEKYSPGKYGYEALHFNDTRDTISEGVTRLKFLRFEHKYNELCSQADISVSLVYHGSCDNLDTLTGVSREHRFANQEGLLFASTLSNFAATYSGGKWNDYTIEQKLENTKVIMTELAKGEFDKNFNRSGYLYICDSSEFTSLNEYNGVTAIHNDNIVVTKSTIKPLYTVQIDNILQSIKNTVTLNDYDRNSEDYKNAVKRMKELIDKDGYDMDTCKRLNPTLAIDIENL